jgi:hypothetical protein
MFRAVEVQNSSPAVFDDEEAIKSSELQCGNREEVEGGDDLAMVVEECEPPLSLILVMSSLQTLQVARNRWFGHVEPELEQFAMDARRAPPRILLFHAPDQLADFVGHLRPSTLSRPPAPKQTEASAMPGHHRFRFDDYEGVSPTRIQSPQHRPEQPVQSLESGATPLSFEHRELLTHSSGFQGESVARYEERTDIGEYRYNKRAHRSDVSRAASSARIIRVQPDSPSRSDFDDHSTFG